MGHATKQPWRDQSGPVAAAQACVAQLWRHNVDLEATLLKPMMVMPGADAGSKASPQEVAQATLDALQRSLSVASSMLPLQRVKALRSCQK